MCILFFYVNSNPDNGGYKLILASNRDEFYARETLPAGKWKNAEHVYGGIDLEPGREGGTWLAIGGKDSVFKIGALLNLTGEPRPRNAAAPKENLLPSLVQNNNSLLGRGMLVADYVKSSNDYTIKNYNEALLADCTKYAAFNFVSIEISATGQPATVAVCSNVPPLLEYYQEGKCYGFGNSLPSVPLKKVECGQQRFKKIVADFHLKLKEDGDLANIQSKTKRQNELVNNLLELLKIKEKFWPDQELKRRAPNWGTDLSAINVNIPHADYGSRTHTVILVDDNNIMHFIEETMTGLNPADERLLTHFEIPYFKEE